MDDYAGSDEMAEGSTIQENGSAVEEKVGNPPISPADELLVKKLLTRVKADQEHHKDAFARMRADMEQARLGATKKWAEHNYTANITGRHIRQQVSTLYAKNPKAIARRRARLDFQIWDENEQSLLAAMDIVAQAQAAMQGAMAADPVGVAMQPPVMPPEVMQAQALVADFQAGMEERQTVDKIGKTLDVLFAYFMEEQQPVDFKTAMKQLVRRTCATCVGYAEIGFQRAYEQNEVVVGRIADVRGQLAHIKALMRNLQDGEESDNQQAKARELELSLQSLQEQEYVLLREGLVFDFPESTHVIPDRRTRNLTGFVGARWLTIQYLYSPEEVLGLFGIDLGREFNAYTQDGKKVDDAGATRRDEVDAEEYACVLKHYDRQSGQCYYLCDGYKGFLRPPAPPDVYVEGFWPLYALTFNEGEDDKELFPPSDVALLRDMQADYNTSRQGKREHRRAARPRFVSVRGALDDESKTLLSDSEPFSVTEINLTGDNTDVAKVIQAIPMPGVDPNIYDVGEIYTDMQLVVGTSPSNVGATAKGETATGEALAEDSRSLAAGSAADDLDAFLSAVARASGQVLLREMSPESVMKIAGRGAVWPPMTLEDIAGEVYLEIEAGSSGKPNAAQEIRNWREMLPYLIQMGKIDPMWLAEESLKRLDDRLDLTDALGEQFLPIVAMSRMAGSQMGSDPGSAPDQQGSQGGANGAPAPSPPAGGERGMGANNMG
jgi:hypothetical protein